MGQKNSKDESVYQQVMEGNVEAIKALCKEGARLEVSLFLFLLISIFY